MSRKIVSPLDRRPRTRAQAGPLTTRYVCPECGKDHPRAEHGIRGLDHGDLWRLRSDVSDKILRAARAHQPPDTLEPMFRLLDAIDARLDRLSEHPMATVQQRQLVADRGPSRKLGGRHGNYGADA